MDDAAFLGTPAKATGKPPCCRPSRRSHMTLTTATHAVGNQFERLYTPESAKACNALKSSKFGRARRNLSLSQPDAQESQRTAQRILQDRKTNFITICSDTVRACPAACWFVHDKRMQLGSLVQAASASEPAPIEEVQVSGTRLKNIFKDAKVAAADSCQKSNLGNRRSGWQHRGASGGKPLQDIANAAGPTSPTQLKPGERDSLPADSGQAASANCLSKASNAIQAEELASAPKRRGIRDGGHENFVRCTMKKGKSSFQFKSRSGCSNRNPKNRRWALKKMAAESLPVAGLGADNANEANLVCTCSFSTCFRTSYISMLVMSIFTLMMLHSTDSQGHEAAGAMFPVYDEQRHLCTIVPTR